MSKIIVKDLIVNIREDEFISLTDIARYKNQNEPFDVIKGWLRTIDTIYFLGLWEQISNSKFKPVEFDRFKRESGYNYFTLSPNLWTERTNAIGITVRRGRYGGDTYAHKDIAFEIISFQQNTQLYCNKTLNYIPTKHSVW